MIAGHSYTGGNGFTAATPPNVTNVTTVMTGLNSWLQALDARYNLDIWGDYATLYPNGGEANRASASVNGMNQGIGGDQFIADSSPTGVTNGYVNP